VPGGGGNLDLIEAARRAGLPFVLTSTETGAAIAAIAQAEVLAHARCVPDDAGSRRGIGR
jgi:thiamine pyrophosphate-dependent acetolactate synthase large subunit-like protein